MQRHLFFTLFIILVAILAGKAQENEYTGTYGFVVDNSVPFIITTNNNTLILDIARQGKINLKPLGKDMFRATHVKPKAIVQFTRDSTGKVAAFKWIQSIPKFHFVKIDEVQIRTDDEIFSKFVGNYRLPHNPSRMMRVRSVEGKLTAQFVNEGVVPLEQVNENRFRLLDKSLTMTFDFISNESGKITSVDFSREGAPELVKVNSNTAHDVYGFDNDGKFTRADSLRGMLTPLRACYDVRFYDLKVKVDPISRSVSGTNVIHFKAVEAFDKLQIDLFGSMKIERITYQNTDLNFTRELNAVFISFPTTVQKGSMGEIKITYGGQPQTPDLSILAGGIFWLWDKEGNDWIETVTQGSGASLWWPCKDHLSDKPDSMSIKVTVPKGLTNISNGKLRRVEELPDGQMRYEWFVGNPISTYCVSMNIGTYVHLTDDYVRNGDTLHLNYYSKPYDVAIGRKIFEEVKPMLSVFEKCFGIYPFAKDDFNVIESIYPMEHQNAITFGSVYNPFYSDRVDFNEIRRTLWHEAAHEWWGNNVTVKDNADLWIHEAFATYAEVLAYETRDGKAAAEKHLREQSPSNREPLVGTYGVNDFRLGDIYAKGALMLHTFRQVINNDSAFLGLLHGLQNQFAFQAIDTRQLIAYVNQKLKTDYTYFFDQYLFHPAIPELQWRIENEKLSYRWQSDVTAFRMPVKVRLTSSEFTFINPTTEWQSIDIAVTAKHFTIDEAFYVGSKRMK